jgi:hypothetical protein
MGPPALLPLRRKACLEFFSPWKIRRLRPGLNPRTWVLECNTHPLDHRSLASSWLSTLFVSMMHGQTNIKRGYIVQIPKKKKNILTALLWTTNTKSNLNLLCNFSDETCGRTQLSTLLIGPFVKLQEAPVSLVISVRPSLCLHGTNHLSLVWFLWNLILEDFS